jgi:hypothetical protein
VKSSGCGLPCGRRCSTIDRRTVSMASEALMVVLR